MALLFRIAGHVSSANAPDSTSNSNNFLQLYKAFEYCIIDAVIRIKKNQIIISAYLSSCTGTPHSSS
jgi:hypothetical protein